MPTFRSWIGSMSLSVVIASGCSNGTDAPEEVLVRESAFSVESIVADATSPNNLSYMSMYEGVAYNRAAAIANSSKVDFAYNYHGGGCTTCRFFENVQAMSTRTGYVSQFSTITKSTIKNAEFYHGVTQGEFAGIRTTSHIEQLFSSKNIETSQIADVTNRTTDVAVGKVFAFVDNAGRKGFFVIGDYTANVPDGSKATLQLQVKMQP